MESKAIDIAAVGKSIVNIQGCHANTERGNDCGYCKKKNPGHLQWGITTPKLSVVDYQKLMDRGWRRCG
jgi:hypothetical protein